MIEGKQIAYYNNVKALLIFFVCLGHFLIPGKEEYGDIANTIYYFIYMFHMPAFVFVSGFFSKRFVNKSDYEKTQKLVGYILLYALFELSLIIISALFTGNFDLRAIMYTESAPWYLLSMAFWMVMVLCVGIFKPAVAITISIAVSILLGFFDNVPNIFSLVRTISFFPFFLLGYYVDSNIISRIKTKPMVLISACGVIFSIIVVYKNLGFVRNYQSILYATSSYNVLDVNEVLAAVMKFGWYAVAVLLITFFLVIVPERKFWFTSIGENTLGIYILHRVVREILDRAGLYNIIESNTIELILIFVVSILCCLCFGTHSVNKPFRKLLKLNYKHFTRDNNREE